MRNRQPTVYFRSVSVEVDLGRTRLPALVASADAVVLRIVNMDSMPAPLEVGREIDVAFFATPVLVVCLHVEIHAGDHDSANFALLLRRSRCSGPDRTFLQKRRKNQCTLAIQCTRGFHIKLVRPLEDAKSLNRSSVAQF
jgi:hypothetical protein